MRATNTAPRYRRDYRSAGRNRAQQKKATTVLPRVLTEREAATRFRSAVINFSAGQLASASQRTKDAAKAWKQARSCPTAASLINLARALPTVRAWLMSEIGNGVQFDGDEAALTKLAQRVARELDKRDGS